MQVNNQNAQMLAIVNPNICHLNVLDTATHLVH